MASHPLWKYSPYLLYVGSIAVLLVWWGVTDNDLALVLVRIVALLGVPLTFIYLRASGGRRVKR
jgi:hypothetical protein